MNSPAASIESISSAAGTRVTTGLAEKERRSSIGGSAERKVRLLTRGGGWRSRSAAMRLRFANTDMVGSVAGPSMQPSQLSMSTTWGAISPLTIAWSIAIDVGEAAHGDQARVGHVALEKGSAGEAVDERELLDRLGPADVGARVDLLGAGTRGALGEKRAEFVEADGHIDDAFELRVVHLVLACPARRDVDDRRVRGIDLAHEPSLGDVGRHDRRESVGQLRVEALDPRDDDGAGRSQARERVARAAVDLLVGCGDELLAEYRRFDRGESQGLQPPVDLGRLERVQRGDVLAGERPRRRVCRSRAARARWEGRLGWRSRGCCTRRRMPHTRHSARR